MKIEDKIISYLDNQMSEEEKSLFEKELGNSVQLRTELENYKSFLKEINSVKDITASNEYFTEMIPQFRGRLALKQRIRFLPKLAFASTIIAAAFVVLFFLIGRNGNNKVYNNFNTAIPNSNNTHADQIENSSDMYILSDQFNIGNLTQSEITYSNSVLDSLLYKELNLSQQSLSDYTLDNNQDLSSIVQGIDEKEADEIYNQLIHKKIY